MKSSLLLSDNENANAAKTRMNISVGAYTNMILSRKSSIPLSALREVRDKVATQAGHSRDISGPQPGHKRTTAGTGARQERAKVGCKVELRGEEAGSKEKYRYLASTLGSDNLSARTRTFPWAEPNDEHQNGLLR